MQPHQLRSTLAHVILGVAIACIVDGRRLPRSIRTCIEVPVEKPVPQRPYRVCYFTTWARYRPPPANMQPADVNPQLCSHLIVAFGWISDDGRMTFHSETDDRSIVESLVVLKELNPNLQVLIAVGGWNFGSEPFKRVVATESSRRHFAESAKSFLERWKLDGLDIDWEYPQAAERRNYTLLLKELEATFSRNTSSYYLLTAAVSASMTNTDGYDIRSIAEYLDFVNVMSYDLHGPWDSRTGHNAPLFSNDGLSLAAAAELWSNGGMPKSKIVMGIATYGHSFKLSSATVPPTLNAPTVSGVSGIYTKSDGFLAFFEICEFLRENGTVQVWDHEAHVPYAYNGDVWVSYDSEMSVRNKVKWIVDNGYAGVMVWELGMDDFTGKFCGGARAIPNTILLAINDGLGKDTRPFRQGRPPSTEFSAVSPSPSHSVIHSSRRPETSTSSQTTTRASIIMQRANAAAPAGGGQTVASQCQFSGFKRKDCTHFLRCDQGRLFEFPCPGGLFFSEERGICTWPQDVKDC